jgi:glycosyltransferase involved in cell wall biosynthesis
MHNKITEILYFSPRDVRKNRVDPIMMMQTCNSIARLGYNVRFIYPYFYRRDNCSYKDIWKLYNIPYKAFKITELPTFFFDSTPVLVTRLIRSLLYFIFVIYILLSLLLNNNKKYIAISRCPTASTVISFMKATLKIKRIILTYEAHTFNYSWSNKYIIRKSDHIFCISENLAKIISDNIGISSDKITIARMGVNSAYYNINKNKTELRKDFGISNNDFIVTYTGKIFIGQKEIEYMLDAAERLKDINFILAGGKPDVVEYYRQIAKNKQLKNIFFLGFQEPSTTIKYQILSDILLIYYPGNWHLKDFVSPGKLMEYMITGNVIVSVDFPVLREVLNDNVNAILVEPDNVTQLCDKIRFTKNNTDIARKIGNQAKLDSLEYTWDKRAEKMINAVNQI